MLLKYWVSLSRFFKTIPYKGGLGLIKAPNSYLPSGRGTRLWLFTKPSRIKAVLDRRLAAAVVALATAAAVVLATAVTATTNEHQNKNNYPRTVVTTKEVTHKNLLLSMKKL